MLVCQNYEWQDAINRINKADFLVNIMATALAKRVNCCAEH